MGNVIEMKARAKRAPCTVNRKVAASDLVRPVSLTRLPNAAYREREYLTPKEADRLIAAAGKSGRHGHRDATLLLLAYRHGLRVSELVNLKWQQFDLGRNPTLHVNRLKNGLASVHPLGGSEVRALRRLEGAAEGLGYVFMSERGAPLTPDAIRKIVQRAAEVARLGFPVHPHMLRHACGFKLANDGRDTRAIQQYLGHANIQHTVRYTELTATRFKDFWRD